MTFFNPIDGSVVLRNRGRFTEAKLYECDGDIFAKYGAGFIRLKRNEATSLPSVFWVKIDSTASWTYDLTTGNMILTFYSAPKSLTRVA